MGVGLILLMLFARGAGRVFCTRRVGHVFRACGGTRFWGVGGNTEGVIEGRRGHVASGICRVPSLGNPFLTLGWAYKFAVYRFTV